MELRYINIDRAFLYICISQLYIKCIYRLYIFEGSLRFPATRFPFTFLLITLKMCSGKTLKTFRDQFQENRKKAFNL